MLGTLHWDVETFMIISCWIVVAMRSLSHESCRENHTAHLMLYIYIYIYILYENHAVYEIITDNVSEPVRPQKVQCASVVIKTIFQVFMAAVLIFAYIIMVWRTVCNKLTWQHKPVNMAN
jgi:hypothetical protein